MGWISNSYVKKGKIPILFISLAMHQPEKLQKVYVTGIS